jgi:hypothetical protein
MVPTVDDPPAMPFTVHVTAVFVVPVTVAAKFWLPFNCTVALAGATAMVTATAFAVMLMLLPVTAPLPGRRTAKAIVPACATELLTMRLVGET